MTHLKTRCGNCGRDFTTQWRAGEHTCKEKLTFLDRLKEWYRFRNISKIQKMRYIAQRDPEFYRKFIEVEKAALAPFTPDRTFEDVYIARKDYAKYILDEDYSSVLYNYKKQVTQP